MYTGLNGTSPLLPSSPFIISKIKIRPTDEIVKALLLLEARGSSFLRLCDDIDDDDGQVDSLIFVWRASYKESILYQGGNFGDKGLQPLWLFIISL